MDALLSPVHVQEIVIGLIFLAGVVAGLIILARRRRR